MLLGDHMLSSIPSPGSDNYLETTTVGYEPALLGSQDRQEFPDLIDIRSEDLLFPETLQPLDSNPNSLKAAIMVVGRRSQSISNLLQEELENKQDIQQGLQKHHVLPDLEEHDKLGMMFELNLAPQQNCKANWFYLKSSKRVYIKTNEIFNVEALYSPRLESEKLFMRIMMVFTSAVSMPVVRCENHSSKDPAKEKNIKHSVLRCENPNVTYHGTVEGKNVSDRLSVRIPLGCLQPNENNQVKQTVALKFVCQNSCVSRRETSIIFHLENANGEILAKRIVAVKICSCPKRDMKKDENEPGRKRSKTDQCPVGKKIMKVESEIKVELEQGNEDDDDSYNGATEPKGIEFVSNFVRVTMDLPDIETAAHTIECAFNKVAGQLALNPDNTELRSQQLRKLKKFYVKAQGLLEKHK